ncbi:hypothetical protein ACFQZI_14590 [Mucilaginibacter lutimaris]|uniref:Uncharacterized protein n=1 Tax=Mucilaginibacter lutimaris TaxID=931629 RepID=A0ABW2ZIN1_9SPHI
MAITSEVKMTFEEFFKKKRIDLVALKAAEPGLFAEFEKHFAQMGEKSFDHTKKYWFNKLRLLYHLVPGPKSEKVHQENQLAEQTIVETLTDTIPAPTAGFKPRFKPGMAAKPTTTTTSDIKDLPFSESATSTPEVNQAATDKDQDPNFRQEKAAMQDIADSTPRITDEDAKTEPATPKPGFKPRFNIKMTKGDGPQTKEFEKEPEPEQATENTGSAPAAESTTPKPGFKPRFNMKAMAPKPAEEKGEANEVAQDKPTNAEAAPAKPGFKPRFNMKMVAPKSAENQEEAVEQPVAQAKPEEPEKPAAEEPVAAPKVGFKPRFNAKTTKPQTPPEE